MERVERYGEFVIVGFGLEVLQAVQAVDDGVGVTGDGGDYACETTSLRD